MSAQIVRQGVEKVRPGPRSMLWLQENLPVARYWIISGGMTGVMSIHVWAAEDLPCRPRHPGHGTACHSCGPHEAQMEECPIAPMGPQAGHLQYQIKSSWVTMCIPIQQGGHPLPSIPSLQQPSRSMATAWLCDFVGEAEVALTGLPFGTPVAISGLGYLYAYRLVKLDPTRVVMQSQTYGRQGCRMHTIVTVDKDGRGASSPEPLSIH